MLRQHPRHQQDSGGSRGSWLGTSSPSACVCSPSTTTLPASRSWRTSCFVASFMAATALKLLREKKDQFDLVINDVHMPDMDGFKLLELVDGPPSHQSTCSSTTLCTASGSITRLR